MPQTSLALLMLLSLALRADAGETLPVDQVPPVADGSPPPAVAPAGGIREAAPPVFYLKDKDGDLVLVPDFSFERYKELVDLEISRNPPQPPRFNFADLVQITGNADQGQAEFQAVFPLRLTQSPEGQSTDWVRIPLRLNSAILSSPPKYEGQGEFFVEYAERGDGYIAWLRSATGTVHQLTLQFKIPLIQTNGDTHLALVAPRTPTRLQLQVPNGRVEGRIENSEESILTVQRPDEGRTVLAVDGIGGSLELSWREQDESPPLLEASTAMLVTVEGKRLECDARLKVRSYGSPIDSFTVRLPPGMELIAVDQPGFRVSPANGGAAERSESKGQNVVVKRLDGKSTGPIEVRLVAWRPPELPEERTQVEVGGFEVLGAVRQWGTIDFAMQGEWQVDFRPGPNVQRVADVGDAGRQQAVVARFDYYRQPCSLQAELLPKQSELRVEPQYVYSLDSTRVALEATLRCRVSGVRAKEVKIDLSGWIVDRVEPPALISEGVSLDRVTPLRIPLSPQTSAAADFELRIQAHRDLEPNQPSLVLLPPRCPDSATSAALIVLVPADNLELVPETDNLKGLVPETLPASVRLPPRQQPPLVYREEPTVEGTAFVGRIQLRQRTVEVEVSSLLRAEADRLQVEQSLAYEISYAPASELLWDVPRTVAESNSLRVTMNSRELSIAPIESSAAEESADRVVLRGELPEPRIGKCLLVIGYTLPLAAVAADEQASLRVPLVQPLAEGGLTITRNAIQVVAAEELSFELTDDRWNLGAEGAPSALAAVLFQARAEGRRNEIALSLSRGQSGTKRRTVVHKAWLQVWLAGKDRRDRACFLLASDQPRIEIRLPRHAHAEGIEVWLAGQPHSDFTVVNGRTVVVNLEQESAPAKRTLELFYWFSTVDPPVGRLTVEPPHLSAATRTDRFYCQLILPEDEHLLWSSPSLTREATWRWRGFYWSPEGNLAQEQLEDWLLASHQEPLPQAVSQYVFSSMGSLQPMVFLSAKRYVLVLVLSGAVLGLGCLWLYVPGLRHPGLLLVAAVGLGSLGLLYPEAALLAGQAAAAGFALVPLARLLQWVVSRRRLKQAVMRSTTFVAPESPAAVGAVRSGEGSSRVGTTPHYPVTAAEPQP